MKWWIVSLGAAVILLLPQDLLRPVHPLGIRPPDMFM